MAGDQPVKTGSRSPSITGEVVAEVLVEAGVIACHVCSSLAKKSTKPDDTDSFTPRVRSDKRSITILLGKAFSPFHSGFYFFFLNHTELQCRSEQYASDIKTM